jgi:hypothetical protein
MLRVPELVHDRLPGDGKIVFVKAPAAESRPLR